MVIDGPVEGYLHTQGWLLFINPKQVGPLRLLKLCSLTEAFEIAAVQEQSMKIISKKAKRVHKVIYDILKSYLFQQQGGKSLGIAGSKESGDVKKLDTTRNLVQKE